MVCGKTVPANVHARSELTMSVILGHANLRFYGTKFFRFHSTLAML